MILNLSDDLLRIILCLSSSHQAFTALVCKKFRVILNEIAFPRPKRPVNISSIFCSMDCMNVYIKNKNFIGKCAHTFSNDTMRIHEWKHATKMLILKHASVEVVKFAWGDFDYCRHDNEDQSIADTTLKSILKCGRVDILEYIMEADWASVLRWKVNNLVSSLSNKRPGDVYREVFILRCASIQAFDWLRNKTLEILERTKCEFDYCGFRWIMRDMRNLKTILHGFAASSTAYELIDRVCSMLDEAHYPRALIFSIVASSTQKLSASAWKWLKKQCSSKDSEAMFEEYKRGLPEAAANLILESSKGGTHLMKLDDFKTEDKESYAVVSDGVRAGGWLHRTFRTIAGVKISIANFTSVCILTRDNTSTRSSGSSTIAELVSRSVYDVMLEAAEIYDNESASLLRRNFVQLVVKFPYESYMVCKRIGMHPNSELRMKALDTLHEGRYIDKSLKECVLNGFHDVVKDFVSNGRIFQIGRFTHARTSLVLDCMVKQNHRLTSTLDMLNVFLPFCSVEEEHVTVAMRLEKFEIAKLLLSKCDRDTKLKVGEEVMSALKPHVKAVELLLYNSCFERSSVFEKEAVSIVSDSAYDSYPIQCGRKRSLPFAALQMSAAFEK